MSLRNSDCSELTKLKANRNQAAYFTRVRAVQNVALGGVFVQPYNPQSGNYNAAKITDIRLGSSTTTYRANPNTVVSAPCLYGVSPNSLTLTTPCNGNVAITGGMNISNPINQPVNDASPQ
jgi:hypothetical protein